MNTIFKQAVSNHSNIYHSSYFPVWVQDFEFIIIRTVVLITDRYLPVCYIPVLSHSSIPTEQWTFIMKLETGGIVYPRTRGRKQLNMSQTRVLVTIRTGSLRQGRIVAAFKTRAPFPQHLAAWWPYFWTYHHPPTGSLNGIMSCLPPRIYRNIYSICIW